MTFLFQLTATWFSKIGENNEIARVSSPISYQNLSVLVEKSMSRGFQIGEINEIARVSSPISYQKLSNLVQSQCHVVWNVPLEVTRLRTHSLEFLFNFFAKLLSFG